MDQVKTRWLLLGVSLSILIPVLMNSSYFYRLSGVANATDVGIAAWLLSALITIGYILYTFWAVPFVRSMQLEFSTLKVMGMVAALATGFIEEIVFRRMLMDWLENRGFGFILQILASSVAFGMVHSVWGALRGEAKIILPVITSTAMLGAAMATLYLFSGRNVLPCIVAHIAINLVIEPWLMLAAVSGKWRR